MSSSKTGAGCPASWSNWSIVALRRLRRRQGRKWRESVTCWPICRARNAGNSKVPAFREKRGFYRLGPVGLASSFPLGLTEARFTRNEGLQTLTIYPDVFAILALPLRGAPSQIHRGGYLLPEGAWSRRVFGLARIPARRQSAPCSLADDRPPQRIDGSRIRAAGLRLSVHRTRSGCRREHRHRPGIDLRVRRAHRGLHRPRSLQPKHAHTHRRMMADWRCAPLAWGRTLSGHSRPIGRRCLRW